MEERHPLVVVLGEACLQPGKTIYWDELWIYIPGMEHLRDRHNQEREISLLLVIVPAGMIRHADAR